jgi:hypothetical protein
MDMLASVRIAFVDHIPVTAQLVLPWRDFIAIPDPCRNGASRLGEFPQFLGHRTGTHEPPHLSSSLDGALL